MRHVADVLRSCVRAKPRGGGLRRAWVDPDFCMTMVATWHDSPIAAIAVRVANLLDLPCSEPFPLLYPTLNTAPISCFAELSTLVAGVTPFLTTAFDSGTAGDHCCRRHPRYESSAPPGSWDSRSLTALRKLRKVEYPDQPLQVAARFYAGRRNALPQDSRMTSSVAMVTDSVASPSMRRNSRSTMCFAPFSISWRTVVSGGVVWAAITMSS